MCSVAIFICHAWVVISRVTAWLPMMYILLCQHELCSLLLGHIVISHLCVSTLDLVLVKMFASDFMLLVLCLFTDLSASYE